MEKDIVCQGRSINSSDLSWLRDWISDHPQWSRKRLSLELCRLWRWQTATGCLKNFAARSFLIKLEQRGLIALPPLREYNRRPNWSVSFRNVVCLPTSDPITACLSELTPLAVHLCSRGSQEEALFRTYLTTYHYLGFGRTVGENLQYLVKDRQGRDLACLLFGSAAWKVAPRDSFIGWSDVVRKQKINLLTNNTRFLILNGVTVPHLASHILGIILRRLSSDWQQKYGHPIHLVETFVEKDRFRGTCYRAANWICVGQTQGRSRQDRHRNAQVPVKDIYLYPSNDRFREVLCP